MAAKKSAKSGEKSIKKPATFKGLLLMKAKGTLPRGLKFSVGVNYATWRTKDGAIFFEMPIVTFAEHAAKSAGFALA